MHVKESCAGGRYATLPPAAHRPSTASPDGLLRRKLEYYMVVLLTEGWTPALAYTSQRIRPSSPSLSYSPTSSRSSSACRSCISCRRARYVAPRGHRPSTAHAGRSLKIRFAYPARDADSHTCSHAPPHQHGRTHPALRWLPTKPYPSTLSTNTMHAQCFAMAAPREMCSQCTPSQWACCAAHSTA